MPLDEGYFAENVRRAAGAHLASMDKLAQYVGLSRPSLMKLVAFRPEKRSKAKAETAMKLAEAFGIELSNLYREPPECLQAVVNAFKEAPIRSFVPAPELRVRDVRDIARQARVVVQMPSKGGRGPKK